MDHTQDRTDQPTVVSNNQDVVPPVPPSVVGPSKEVEPSPHDSINASEQRPEVTPEREDLKVEALPSPPDQIKLTEQISQQPTAAASSTTATIIDPSMTEAQAITEVKKPDKTSSFVWRALTFIRALGKQRMKQKISTQNPL